MDEMKIKEDIVYNHHSGQIVGFTNIGEANNDIVRITREMQTGSGTPAVDAIATHVMAFMVQGICSSLKFPLAHYPTKNLTGDQLYGMVWEVVEALEVAGFKVLLLRTLSLTCTQCHADLTLNHSMCSMFTGYVYHRRWRFSKSSIFQDACQ